ncbi:unnamed protein product [Cercospora beticola]|nr:unnamed protein product [Cercospora beticola]
MGLSAFKCTQAYEFADSQVDLMYIVKHVRAYDETSNVFWHNNESERKRSATNDLEMTEKESKLLRSVVAGRQCIGPFRPKETDISAAMFLRGSKLSSNMNKFSSTAKSCSGRRCCIQRGSLFALTTCLTSNVVGNPQGSKSDG